MTNKEAIKRLKQVQAEFNENWVDYGGINQAFEKAYQALEERPQGEWIIHPHSMIMRCSLCGNEETAEDNGIVDTNKHFCAHCGAKMKGGTE